MTSYGRVARLTALALATGTLVAAGAGTAGASVATTALAGKTSGNVLTIEINLPAALPDIPGLGHHIVQSISLSDGSVVSGDAASALGHAALGKGTITDLLSSKLPLGALFPEVTSDLANPSVQVKGIDLSNSQAGLTLKVLPTTSEVSNPNVAGTQALTTSSTALDRIKLDIPGVGAALPTALKPVTDALNTVVGTVQAPAGQVTASVGQAVDTINGALASTPAAPVGAALTQAKDTLNTTLTGLQTLPKTIAAANTSLIDIAQLTSLQNVNRTGSVVAAHSENALTNISLLGGLITVDALKSGVTAAVDTATHKATVSYLPESNQIVKVHVQGVADLILDATGVHLAGLPSALPVGTVTDAVNGAVQQILDATKLLGIHVGSGTNAAPVYAADGSGAAGSASGAFLVINPSALGLPDSAPLLKLSFVNSAASVSAKAQAVVPPSLIKTPAQAASGSITSPVMAHTGAAFGLTAPLAIGLMGLAVVARRRRLLND